MKTWKWEKNSFGFGKEWKKWEHISFLQGPSLPGAPAPSSSHTLEVAEGLFHPTAHFLSQDKNI